MPQLQVLQLFELHGWWCGLVVRKLRFKQIAKFL